MRRYTILLAGLIALASPRNSAAQRVAIDSVVTTDTTLRHEVRLIDGTILMGRIVHVTADSLRIQLQTGPLAVPRNVVSQVRQYRSANLRRGEFWFENPHPTRLLFAPTGFALRQGEAYFNNIYLFFNGFALGVTDRFTFGGGFSVFPTEEFSDNLFYLTPKLTLVDTRRFQFALGGFLGWLGAAADAGETGSFGILYGVGSMGDRNNNLSVGLGWGYAGGDIADRPLVTVGVLSRFSRRAAFISENWFATWGHEYNSLFSYGLRFLWDWGSVDLAFWNVPDESLFPGIPFVGFAIRF